MVLFVGMFIPEMCGKVQRLVIVACYATIAANAFRVSTEKTIDFRSNEGNIAVYDKAMPEWLTSLTEKLLQQGERWLYQHHDQLANVAQRSGGNLDWAAPISSDFFMKSKLWLVVNRIAVDFTGHSDYVAYLVQGVMLRRGDSPTVIKGEANSDDILCRIFLSKGSTSNSEMSFFNRNREIVQPVRKKFNRIVVWNASLDYNMKQPGFQTFKTEYSLLIKLTRDERKVKKELNYVQVVRENEKKQKLMNFPTFGEKGSQYTNEFFDKHVTRKFYAKNGGVISYFDGIMNESELATLRNYLITHNTAYSNTGFSTVEDDDGDNVSWIAMFLPHILNNTKILDLVKGMARYLSGEDDWYPYDVSLNMIQSTFHTRIHEDCQHYEHEYTFLLYLNPNWTEDMYGETIFLDQVQDMKYGKKKKVTREKAYETIVSVKPKYGRMAMFRNIIPHSARPPSPDFHGTRYTFAVKLSRNRTIGLTKILRELLEFKKGSKDEGGQLFKKIRDMGGSSHVLMPEEVINNNIRKYRKMRQEVFLMDSEYTVTGMIRKKYIGVSEPSI